MKKIVVVLIAACVITGLAAVGASAKMNNGKGMGMWSIRMARQRN